MPPYEQSQLNIPSQYLPEHTILPTSTENPQYDNPFLATLKWPRIDDDVQGWVEGFFSANWPFFLTSHLRNHIITNCYTLCDFTSFSKINQLVELLTLTFQPSTLIALYYDCIQHYTQLVDNGEVPFVQAWYLNLLQLNTPLPYWESHDWFWSMALNKVSFVPSRAFRYLQKTLPSWTTIHGSYSNHHAKNLIPQRFPGLLHQHHGPAVDHEPLNQFTSLDSIKDIPSVKSDGIWGCIYHPQSLFPYAVIDIDVFFSGLYKQVTNASFAYSQALDLVQTFYSLSPISGNTHFSDRTISTKFQKDTGLISYHTIATSFQTILAASPNPDAYHQIRDLPGVRSVQPLDPSLVVSNYGGLGIRHGVENDDGDDDDDDDESDECDLPINSRINTEYYNIAHHTTCNDDSLIPHPLTQTQSISLKSPQEDYSDSLYSSTQNTNTHSIPNRTIVTPNQNKCKKSKKKESFFYTPSHFAVTLTTLPDPTFVTTSQLGSDQITQLYARSTQDISMETLYYYFLHSIKTLAADLIISRHPDGPNHDFILRRPGIHDESTPYQSINHSKHDEIIDYKKAQQHPSFMKDNLPTFDDPEIINTSTGLLAHDATSSQLVTSSSSTRLPVARSKCMKSENDNKAFNTSPPHTLEPYTPSLHEPHPESHIPAQPSSLTNRLPMSRSQHIKCLINPSSIDANVAEPSHSCLPTEIATTVVQSSSTATATTATESFKANLNQINNELTPNQHTNLSRGHSFSPLLQTTRLKSKEMTNDLRRKYFHILPTTFTTNHGDDIIHSQWTIQHENTPINIVSTPQTPNDDDLVMGNDSLDQELQSNKNNMIAKPFHPTDFYQSTLLTPSKYYHIPHTTPLTSLPPAVSNFTSKEYSPQIFAALRSYFNIDEKNFWSQISNPYDLIEYESNSKSGSFFSFSKDRHFMIKTISEGEAKLLRSILSVYYRHIMNNPNSLLCRIYGLFAVRFHSSELQQPQQPGNMNQTHNTPSTTPIFKPNKATIIGKIDHSPKGDVVSNNKPQRPNSIVNNAKVRPPKPKSSNKKIFYIVMESIVHHTLPSSFGGYPVKITKLYDLKGSTQGRMADPKDITKKDLDWIRDRQETGKIMLNPALNDLIYDQLKSDTELLGRLGTMDYSLLVGIMDLEKQLGSEVAMKGAIDAVMQKAEEDKNEENAQKVFGEGSVDDSSSLSCQQTNKDNEFRYDQERNHQFDMNNDVIIDPQMVSSIMTGFSSTSPNALNTSSPSLNNLQTSQSSLSNHTDIVLVEVPEQLEPQPIASHLGIVLSYLPQIRYLCLDPYTDRFSRYYPKESSSNDQGDVELLSSSPKSQVCSNPPSPNNKKTQASPSLSDYEFDDISLSSTPITTHQHPPQSTQLPIHPLLKQPSLVVSKLQLDSFLAAEQAIVSPLSLSQFLHTSQNHSDGDVNVHASIESVAKGDVNDGNLSDLDTKNNNSLPTSSLTNPSSPSPSNAQINTCPYDVNPLFQSIIAYRRSPSTLRLSYPPGPGSFFQKCYNGVRGGVDTPLPRGVSSNNNNNTASLPFQLVPPGSRIPYHYDEGSNCIYFFGLIDFLNTWGLKKRLEATIKGLYFDPNEISPMEPYLYQRRMMQFLSTHVFDFANLPSTLYNDNINHPALYYTNNSIGLDGSTVDWSQYVVDLEEFEIDDDDGDDGNDKKKGASQEDDITPTIINESKLDVDAEAVNTAPPLTSVPLNISIATNIKDSTKLDDSFPSPLDLLFPMRELQQQQEQHQQHEKKNQSQESTQSRFPSTQLNPNNDLGPSRVINNINDPTVFTTCLGPSVNTEDDDIFVDAVPTQSSTSPRIPDNDLFFSSPHLDPTLGEKIGIKIDNYTTSPSTLDGIDQIDSESNTPFLTPLLTPALSFHEDQEGLAMPLLHLNPIVHLNPIIDTITPNSTLPTESHHHSIGHNNDHTAVDEEDDFVLIKSDAEIQMEKDKEDYNRFRSLSPTKLNQPFISTFFSHNPSIIRNESQQITLDKSEFDHQNVDSKHDDQ